MPSGDVLRAKVAAILKRTQVTSRVVKFRSVSASGGNALLGLGQTLNTTDVVCDPQPVVELLKPEDVASAAGILQLGDYSVLFDGGVPESTLKTHEILYGTDVLKIISYDPVVFAGVVVAWKVLARTAKAS